MRPRPPLQTKSPQIQYKLIGAPGFEPGTSPTRTVRATRLRHAPMEPVSHRRSPGVSRRTRPARRRPSQAEGPQLRRRGQPSSAQRSRRWTLRRDRPTGEAELARGRGRGQRAGGARASRPGRRQARRCPDRVDRAAEAHPRDVSAPAGTGEPPNGDGRLPPVTLGGVSSAAARRTGQTRSAGARRRGGASRSGPAACRAGAGERRPASPGRTPGCDPDRPGPRASRARPAALTAATRRCGRRRRWPRRTLRTAARRGAAPQPVR